MKKIVVFQGSPRKNGYCAALLESLMAGAKSKGAEIVFCDLNAEGIRGCQGCNYCKSHEGCVQRDAMAEALAALPEAAGVAASFPIYWGGISGQSKLFIDRLYAFFRAGESTLPGKKIVTVYTHGAPAGSYDGAIAGTNANFSHLGWTVEESIVAAGTDMGRTEVSAELLEKAFAAGCALAE